MEQLQQGESKNDNDNEFSVEVHENENKTTVSKNGKTFQRKKTSDEMMASYLKKIKREWSSSSLLQLLKYAYPVDPELYYPPNETEVDMENFIGELVSVLLPISTRIYSIAKVEEIEVENENENLL